jgi:hypothetical protein
MEKQKEINIVWVDINELKPSEYNPRKMTEKEAADLYESINRFGLVEPILVNSAPSRKNIIIGGHQRYNICKEMGIKKIPVVYLDIPDEKKEMELNLRLNKNIGQWDWNLLGNFDENLLLDVGFPASDLSVFLDDFNLPDPGVQGEAPELNDYLIVVFDNKKEFQEIKDKMGMGKNKKKCNFNDLKKAI